MFLYFTPFTFLFLSTYFLVILFIISLDNIYLFWLYIEILILLFIGISFSIFSNSFTQLILYFLIQTIASFRVLVFYSLSIYYLVFIALFLKLGMFPFISWYINVLFRFPSFILFLAITFHKLPPLFLFVILYSSYYHNFIFVSILFSIIVGGLYILAVLDLRYLLIVSSIANNRFLLIGLISGNNFIFFCFYRMYVLNIFFILKTIGYYLKPLFFSRDKTRNVFLLMLLLFNIASLPPFPIFFLKFYLILSFLFRNYFSIFGFILLILANVSIIARYCSMLIKLIVNSYSNSRNYLLF